MIEVLLADNQALTSSGMRAILSQDAAIRLAGMIVAPETLLSMVETYQPSLLIMDYNLPAFIRKEQIGEVQKSFPKTNILVVSSDDNRSAILDVVRLGVKGYITKSSDHDEIITAVKTVGSGGKYFCQMVLDIILESSVAPEPEVRKSKSALSERELELLLLLAKGYSTHRAAEKLNLSPHTIHSHRKNIIKKLNIKSPTQYVLFAMDLGLM
jgi:two-component system, NarL family, invasion response regulator UvrY